jgi:uncharacterized membrane protein YphA (DoxX/SURF4 family)
MSSDGSSGPNWGLVLVRIVSGAILLSAGWSKLTNGVDESLVLGTQQAFLEAPAFIRAWGQNVVLPHPWFFSHLILWGELLGGLALFLGAFTRPAGYAVAFMFANFYFVGPEQARSLVLLLSTCGFACAISRAGLRVGLDVFLVERLPAWATWLRT